MKSFFQLSFVFLLVFGGIASSADAATAKTKTTTLTYAVYAGGIHAVNAKLTLQKDATSYATTLNAGTQGFLKSLANWSGQFSSKGKIVSGKLYTTTHRSDSNWKGTIETKIFAYDSKGNITSYKVSEAGADKTPKDIDKSLGKGVTDNLSATFQLMLNLPNTKTCAGDSVVYDGDRTYRLTFSDTTTETLKKSDYNIFDGTAISCTVEVKPEKGKWRKKPRGWLSIQEQGRQKGELPTIWFGKVAGQTDMYVPVKIRVKTDYGTLFMHLTSIK